jgi:pimeloyl-ACP methyl ester carboxylesterase
VQARKNMARQEKKMEPVKIIILHGWVYSTEKWTRFADFLDKCRLPYRILNIPGLTKKPDVSWTLNDYVEWLKATIEETNGQVVLVGHSNGGRIAIAFAAKYPEKLKHLVLIDSAGLIDRRFKAVLKKSVSKTLAKLGKKLTKSEVAKNLLYKVIREGDYNEASPEMKKTMENLVSVDLGKKAELIKTPTTIIWGEKDQSTPVYQGKLLNKKIKQSNLFVLPNANHSPHNDYYREIVEIIRKEAKI